MGQKRARNVQVAFYVVARRDDEKPLVFNAGRVLQQVDGLEREAGKAYLPRGLFEELLCTVHGTDTTRMLVGWTINRESAIFVEHKGEVSELALLEDEGVADPTYLMFFPDNIVGVIRPTSKSPGPILLSEYLNQFTEAKNLSLAPLIDSSVLRKLQRPGEDVVNVAMRVRRENLPAIQSADPDLYSVLQDAAALAGSTEVKLVLKVTRKREKAAWWAQVRPRLKRLVQSGAVEEFATLSVRMRDGVIHLLREHLTFQAPIPLGPAVVLRPESAVSALMTAYEQRQDAIREAASIDLPR